jgi:YVTN family beta-propeller protein
VYVFNTGERTMSIIDSTTDELLATTMIGTTASFPSNQYTPTLVSAPGDALWLNVAGGVRAIDVTSLESIAYVETGSDANWLERTPSGDRLLVSAREPAHTQFRVIADPNAEEFGAVIGRIDRTGNDAGTGSGPGPCDVTIGPDGAYAFVPDLYGGTLAVLDIEAFEVVAKREVPPVLDGAASANPYMGTASWDGESLVVENDEGAYGTESIWDVSDPTRPEERVRLTEADGLGRTPLTSEIGPDSRTAYVFTPGTEDLTVLDLEAGEVTTRIDLGGQAFTGTWNRSRRKLYVPVQTADAVRVIDHETHTVTETIPIGSKPYGATARAVRPAPTRTRNTMTVLASVGLADGGETTYCIGNCHCGTHDRSP